MKLMMNGALTIGTLDGANVEIHEAVGDDNMFLFGMHTDEVNKLRYEGYNPFNYYNNNPELRKVIDFISGGGVDGKDFSDISSSVLHHDPFMVLADFADYQKAQKRVRKTFVDKSFRWRKWNLTSQLRKSKH
jgi:starch phosphorylase